MDYERHMTSETVENFVENARERSDPLKFRLQGLVIGKMYMSCNKLKEAKHHVDAFLTARPQNSNAFRVLGDILAKSDNIEECLDAYRTSLILDPSQRALAAEFNRICSENQQCLSDSLMRFWKSKIPENSNASSLLNGNCSNISNSLIINESDYRHLDILEVDAKRTPGSWKVQELYLLALIDEERHEDVVLHLSTLRHQPNFENLGRYHHLVSEFLSDYKSAVNSPSKKLQLVNYMLISLGKEVELNLIHLEFATKRLKKFDYELFNAFEEFGESVDGYEQLFCARNELYFLTAAVLSKFNNRTDASDLAQVCAFIGLQEFSRHSFRNIEGVWGSRVYVHASVLGRIAAKTLLSHEADWVSNLEESWCLVDGRMRLVELVLGHDHQSMKRSFIANDVNFDKGFIFQPTFEKLVDFDKRLMLDYKNDLNLIVWMYSFGFVTKTDDSPNFLRHWLYPAFSRVPLCHTSISDDLCPDDIDWLHIHLFIEACTFVSFNSGLIRKFPMNVQVVSNDQLDVWKNLCLFISSKDKQYSSTTTRYGVKSFLSYLKPKALPTSLLMHISKVFAYFFQNTIQPEALTKHYESVVCALAYECVDRLKRMSNGLRLNALCRGIFGVDEKHMPKRVARANLDSQLCMLAEIMYYRENEEEGIALLQNSTSPGASRLKSKLIYQLSCKIKDDDIKPNVQSVSRRLTLDDSMSSHISNINSRNSVTPVISNDKLNVSKTNDSLDRSFVKRLVDDQESMRNEFSKIIFDVREGQKEMSTALTDCICKLSSRLDLIAADISQLKISMSESAKQAHVPVQPQQMYPQQYLPHSLPPLDPLLRQQYQPMQMPSMPMANLAPFSMYFNNLQASSMYAAPVNPEMAIYSTCQVNADKPCVTFAQTNKTVPEISKVVPVHVFNPSSDDKHIVQSDILPPAVQPEKPFSFSGLNFGVPVTSSGFDSSLCTSAVFHTANATPACLSNLNLLSSAASVAQTTYSTPLFSCISNTSELSGKPLGESASRLESFSGFPINGSVSQSRESDVSLPNDFRFDLSNASLIQNLQNTSKPELDGSNEYAAEEDLSIEFAPVVTLPSVSDLKTGEENDDQLFCNRAKLYRYDPLSSQWKERGLGNLKILKDRCTNKTRLLMRREQILKVCLNHAISQEMNLVKNPTNPKSLQWVASDFSDGQATVEKFAVRFKHDETVQLFERVFNECKSGYRGEEAVKSKSFNHDSLKPLIGGEKKKVWACNDCYAENPEIELACLCCKSAKPGSESNTTKPAVNSNISKSAAMFSQGPPPTGFSVFGASPVEKTSFAFKMAADSTKTINFSFGTSSGSAVPTTDLFKVAHSESVAKPFVFQTVPGRTTDQNSLSSFSFLPDSTISKTSTPSASVQPSLDKNIFFCNDSTKTSPFVMDSNSFSLFSHQPDQPADCPSHQELTVSGSECCHCEDDQSEEYDQGYDLEDNDDTEDDEDVSHPSPLNRLITVVTNLPEPEGDVIFVSELLPDEESIKLAEKYMLPKTFYNYRNKSPCPGCLGCDDEDVDESDVAGLSTGISDTPPASNAQSTYAEPNWPGPGAGQFVFGNSNCDVPSAFSLTTQPSSAFVTPDTTAAESFASSSFLGFGDLAGTHPKECSFGKTTDRNMFKVELAKPIFGSPANMNDSGEVENVDVHFKPVVQLEKVETMTGEENDECQFESRAKLYRFDGPTKQWKERGCGNLKIVLNPETRKARIVMRRDQVLKLCANHTIGPEMDLRPPPGDTGKAWTWQATDFAEGESCMENLCVRFGKVDMARQFKVVFEEMQRFYDIGS